MSATTSASSESLGTRDEVLRFTHEVLGLAAVDREGADAVALREGCDTFAEGVNLADDLVAGREGKRGPERVVARSHRHVGRAGPGRAHANPNLAGLGLDER